MLRLQKVRWIDIDRVSACEQLSEAYLIKLLGFTRGGTRQMHNAPRHTSAALPLALRVAARIAAPSPI